jgi:signal transduction histidine kinase
VFLGGLFLALVLFFLFILNQEQVDHEKRVLKLYQTNLDQLASQLSYPLKIKDFNSVHSLLKNSSFIQTAYNISLETIDGLLIYEKEQGYKCTKTEINREIIFNNRREGFIVLCVDLNNNADYKMLKMFLLFFIFVITAFLVFTEVIRYKLRPIERFISKIRAINLENISQDMFYDQNEKEEILIELNKVMRDLIKRLVEFNSLLIEKNSKASKYELAKEVMHDLQSPLTSLQLIKKNHGVLPEYSRMFDLITDRIANLISLMLAKSGTDFLEINLKSVIASIVEEKTFEYSEIKLLIKVDIKDIAFIKLPGSLNLKRMLSNFINNSIESKDFKSTEVQIYGYLENNYLIISIMDDGPGFSLTYLKAFQDNLSYTTKANGHGIGISSARGQIEEVGGVLHIENTSVLGGARITLKLPFAPA